MKVLVNLSDWMNSFEAIWKERYLAAILKLTVQCHVTGPFCVIFQILGILFLTENIEWTLTIRVTVYEKALKFFENFKN